MKRFFLFLTCLSIFVATLAAKDRPPLHVAAMDKNPELVKSLINSGANVNEKDELGWTPLHMVFATQSSLDKSEIFINTVRVLLSHNADINAKTNDGTTVLMLAAGTFMAKPEIVQFLLQYKPDINAVDANHKTALILAAANARHPEVISLLLNAGANAKLEDNTGRTALDWFDQNKRISNNPVRKELKDRT
jgi:ankyrin repeat protein